MPLNSNVLVLAQIVCGGALTAEQLWLNSKQRCSLVRSGHEVLVQLDPVDGQSCSAINPQYICAVLDGAPSTQVQSPQYTSAVLDGAPSTQVQYLMEPPVHKYSSLWSPKYTSTEPPVHKCSA
jgi:hypothetical protein